MPATHDQQTELDELRRTDQTTGIDEPTGADVLAALVAPARDDEEETATEREGAARPGGFGAWYRSRPLIGGIITVLGAAAMFLSSQLDLGNLTIHVGVEGMQATILPIVVALAGVLAVVMPAHRIFYGVIVLAAAVYSLVAVNLGGFFVGFLLGCVGGIMVVSWAPRRESDAAADADPAPAVAEDDGEPDAAPGARAHEAETAA